MGLTPTLILFGFSAAGIAFCAWYERRPKELGEVRYFPAIAVMAICVLLAILSLAHLVSLVTGVPLKGRMGF